MTEIDDVARRIHDLLRATPDASPTHRALHAKGVVTAGRFTASGELAGLTTADHLVTGAVEAVVRFSHPSADPGVSDAIPSGRGMAVKLATTAGSHQLVAVSSPAFLVRDGDAFVELILARTPDPETGVPDPHRVGAFLADHPEALPAVEYALTAPVPHSYAELLYNGLHTFFLVDADGVRRPFRYRFAPTIEAAASDPEEHLGADHLAEDLGTRLAAGPLDFTLLMLFGADDDPLEDSTAIWSPRPAVRVGVLTLDSVVVDPEPVIFDPTNVVPGVELSDDPILAIRRAVYGLSYARRTSPT